MYPLPVQANLFRFIPSIMVEERFDDNLFAVDENPESDFVTVIQPAIGVHRAGSRLKWQADYSLRYELLASHPELNQGTPYQNLDTSLGLEWGRGGRLHLVEDLSYSPEQPEFLGGSHVGDVLGEGIRTRRGKSIRNVAGAGIQQPVTSKIGVRAQYGHGVSRYDDPQLIDNTHQEISGGFFFIIDPLNIASLDYRSQRIHFRVGGDSRIHYVSAGYLHSLEPVMLVGISLGAAFPDTAQSEEPASKWVGQLEIRREMKTWQGKVRYSRQVGVSGGYLQELSLSDRISVILNRNVTQVFSVTLTGNYARNKSAVGANVDIHSSEVRAEADYIINPMVSLNFGYSNFRQDAAGTVGADIVRNQALISLTAKH